MAGPCRRWSARAATNRRSISRCWRDMRCRARSGKRPLATRGWPAVAQGADRRGVELWVALMGLAWTESAVGDFAAAKKRLTELLKMADPALGANQVRKGLPSSRVIALSFLSQYCADLGHFEEGMETA